MRASSSAAVIALLGMLSCVLAGLLGEVLGHRLADHAVITRCDASSADAVLDAPAFCEEAAEDDSADEDDAGGGEALTEPVDLLALASTRGVVWSARRATDPPPAYRAPWTRQHREPIERPPHA